MLARELTADDSKTISVQLVIGIGHLLDILEVFIAEGFLHADRNRVDAGTVFSNLAEADILVSPSSPGPFAAPPSPL